MNLKELRERIDKTDELMLKLFVERMAVCSEIGEFKRENGLPVYDEIRECEKLEIIRGMVDDDLKDSAERFFRCVFDLSKELQAANC